MCEVIERFNPAFLDVTGAVTRDSIYQRLVRLVGGQGEICHRHRRHPQDRQDEVQRR